MCAESRDFMLRLRCYLPAWIPTEPMMQPRLGLRETAANPLPGRIAKSFELKLLKTQRNELRTIRRGQFRTSSKSYNQSSVSNS